MSVCTVDGQRFDIGDVDSAFSIQSCVSPLAYAVAVEDIGIAKVHQHVGVTPSGLGFDDMSLNSDNLPHNPLVSAGAMATCACVQPGASMSTRFRYFTDRLSALAGGEHINFSQVLCE